MLQNLPSAAVVIGALKVLWPLKEDQNKGLKGKPYLIMIESTAECSPKSILQYFWPALSNNPSWKTIFGLLLSGAA